MPLVFTREEIQEYLSEMGYGELNEDDMEKFVKDLRKLVKNETKKRRRRRLGHSGLSSDLSSTVDDPNSTRNSENTDYTNQENATEQSTRPRLISTPKSKQKKYPPRRVEDSSDFSVPDQEASSASNNYKSTPTTEADTSTSETKTSNDISPDQSSTSHVSAPQPSRVPLQENNGQRKSEVDGARRKAPAGGKDGPGHGQGRSSGKQPPSGTAPPQVGNASGEADVPNGDSSSSTGTLSDTDLLNLMEHILRTGLGQASYATSDTDASAKKKLEIPLKIRRDPVALYHWYKTFWDKQKPPGEDRHMQLRWNVRAGTIGRFPCDADGVPIHYLPIIPKQRKKIRAF